MDATRAWLAVIAAGSLYTIALGVLAGMALGALRRRLVGPGDPAAGTEPRSRTRRCLAAGVLALAVLQTLCVIWAFAVEPVWPQVEELRVETPKLAAGARPVRLVLVADTHCDPRARTESLVPELVRELKPDAIVFAGDAVNSREGLANFKGLMTRLAEIAPTWAVRGNWEAWWFQTLDLYSGTGVKELGGKAMRVAAGGSEVWLCGGVFEEGEKNRAALKEVPGGRFAVFVHHYPEVGAAALRDGGADLALGADTHGGQVRVPLVGPLVRLSRSGEYFDIGAHRVGRGILYVNRGLGMEGGTAPRVRFMCRPEITLIEIVPAEAPPADN
ncbi:MAG: metallophosphoesterase [Planctomycetota bacterium]